MMDEKLAKIEQRILSREIKEFQMERFLECYYELYIDKLDEYQEGDEDLYDDEDYEFPVELSMPLSERTSGVLEALTAIIDMGINLNESDGFTPLWWSVSYADAAMTEFLIKNGANPRYWMDMEEYTGFGNHYYDDLDIIYLNKPDFTCQQKYDKFVQSLLNTAKVLATVGKLDSYYGLCLHVDNETRTISFSRPEYKF